MILWNMIMTLWRFSFKENIKFENAALTACNSWNGEKSWQNKWNWDTEEIEEKEGYLVIWK